MLRSGVCSYVTHNYFMINSQTFSQIHICCYLTVFISVLSFGGNNVKQFN